MTGNRKLPLSLKLGQPQPTSRNHQWREAVASTTSETPNVAFWEEALPDKKNIISVPCACAHTVQVDCGKTVQLQRKTAVCNCLQYKDVKNIYDISTQSAWFWASSLQHVIIHRDVRVDSFSSWAPVLWIGRQLPLLRAQTLVMPEDPSFLLQRLL